MISPNNTIVPVSAKTTEGLPELLMVMTGLAQRFEQKLNINGEGPGKATILEVSEAPVRNNIRCRIV